MRETCNLHLPLPLKNFIFFYQIIIIFISRNYYFYFSNYYFHFSKLLILLLLFSRVLPFLTELISLYLL